MKMLKTAYRAGSKLAVQVDFRTDLDIRRLLACNFGSPYRYGLDIDHHCLEISADAAADPAERTVKRLTSGLVREAASLKETGTVKQRRVYRDGPEQGENHAPARCDPSGPEIERLRSAGGRVVASAVLPLIRLGAVQTGAGGEPSRAVLCYALYLNTRLHRVNLYLSPKTGWGLCAVYESPAEAERDQIPLMQMISQFRTSAWPILMKLNTPRLSAEFERRNRWMHPTQSGERR